MLVNEPWKQGVTVATTPPLHADLSSVEGQLIAVPRPHLDGWVIGPGPGDTGQHLQDLLTLHTLLAKMTVVQSPG